MAAKTILPMMNAAHKKINDAAIQAQKAIDEENGVGMNAVPAAFPERRVNDLLYKIGSEETTPEQARELLREPIENNCRKFFDEHVRHNADVRFKAGLAPMIVRTSSGNCCKWCSSIAGKYDYADVKNGGDVFRRHARCRCTVEYVCNGKKQDVWSKKMWEADQETLEKRAKYGLGEKHSSRAAMANGSSTAWPPSQEKISKSELSELRQYAEERNIHLRFFDSFDGDSNLVKEFIDAMDKVAKDYPEVYSAGKGGLQIINDPTIKADTYAVANGRTSIRINTAAFRSREFLQRDYDKCVEDKMFVPGNATQNIAYHEMGHIVCNTYQVSRREPVKGVFTDNISVYAKKNASEAIAESFSDVYSGRKTEEALTIKTNYDRLIKERGRKQ